MPSPQQLEVMIVDDATVSRILICESLSAIGVVNQRVAKNGEEALKSLMTRPVHLVISDYNMPKMDGLELLRAVRGYKPTSRVGFILVSGRNDKNVINEGRKLGLNNFIAKPFTTAGMKSCLEGVVGKFT